MRKHTRRVVRPRVDPITAAIRQASLLTIDEWNTQVIPVQVALDQILAGNWDKLSVWDNLFMAANRIESMLKLRHMPDHGFLKQANLTFRAALAREEQTGAKALKHDEIAVLREVVSVYGDLLKEVTHRQFTDACRHTDANVIRLRKSKDVTNVAHCLLDEK